MTNTNPIPASTCPMCGKVFDPAKDTLLECRMCGCTASTACCMMGGRGSQCVECDDGKWEE